MRILLPLVFCLTNLLRPALADEGVATALPGSIPAEAVVRNAERLRAQAVAKRNIDVLRRLIGGDYYHVESNGRVRTKAEFLQALARNEFRIRSYGVDDMEIRVLDGGAAAVVTGSYHAVSEDPQAGQPVRGRYVRIWTRHPDGWRNALHQSTRIHSVAAGPAVPGARALQ